MTEVEVCDTCGYEFDSGDGFEINVGEWICNECKSITLEEYS